MHPRTPCGSDIKWWTGTANGVRWPIHNAEPSAESQTPFSPSARKPSREARQPSQTSRSKSASSAAMVTSQPSVSIINAGIDPSHCRRMDSHHLSLLQAIINHHRLRPRYGDTMTLCIPRGRVLAQNLCVQNISTPSNTMTGQGERLTLHDLSVAVIAIVKSHIAVILHFAQWQEKVRRGLLNRLLVELVALVLLGELMLAEAGAGAV